MNEEEQRLEQIAGLISLLANAKNKPVEPKVRATYARILGKYPLEAIEAAVVSIAANASPYFPPVGGIIAEIATWLRGTADDRGRSLILSVEDAWKLAERTIKRYSRETRPNPQSGNPAIDSALRAMGGVAACQWPDAIGAGIIKREFFEQYEKQIATPEHIRWALDGGAHRPSLLPAVEIPDYEIAGFSEEAKLHGATLPPVLQEAIDGRPQRAKRLDGKPTHYPFALPARAGEPLTPERREQLSAEASANLARLVENMRLPATSAPSISESAVETVANITGVTVERFEWNDGQTSVVAIENPVRVAEELRRERLRVVAEKRDREAREEARRQERA